MSLKHITGQLDDLRYFIKNDAKTGGDLYNAFKSYSDLVLENWPDGLSDRGNWKREMEFVLEKIKGKRAVVQLKRSSDLLSFKNDALEVIHHFNSEFIMFSNGKE